LPVGAELQEPGRWQPEPGLFGELDHLGEDLHDDVAQAARRMLAERSEQQRDVPQPDHPVAGLAQQPGAAERGDRALAPDGDEAGGRLGADRERRVEPAQDVGPADEHGLGEQLQVAGDGAEPPGRCRIGQPQPGRHVAGHEDGRHRPVEPLGGCRGADQCRPPAPRGRGDQRLAVAYGLEELGGVEPAGLLADLAVHRHDHRDLAGHQLLGERQHAGAGPPGARPADAQHHHGRAATTGQRRAKLGRAGASTGRPVLAEQHRRAVLGAHAVRHQMHQIGAELLAGVAELAGGEMQADAGRAHAGGLQRSHQAHDHRTRPDHLVGERGTAGQQHPRWAREGGRHPVQVDRDDSGDGDQQAGVPGQRDRAVVHRLPHEPVQDGLLHRPVQGEFHTVVRGHVVACTDLRPGGREQAVEEPPPVALDVAGLGRVAVHPVEQARQIRGVGFRGGLRHLAAVRQRQGTHHVVAGAVDPDLPLRAGPLDVDHHSGNGHRSFLTDENESTISAYAAAAATGSADSPAGPARTPPGPAADTADTRLSCNRSTTVWSAPVRAASR
jgi:hypothetical protein